MYVTIYSPAGETFEVTRDRASALVLNEGWTQTPPTFATGARSDAGDEDEEVEEGFYQGDIADDAA